MKDEIELVSVIIPAYNVENFINRCVDSVINQTYKNIQVIIIDDGSTDKTGRIIDEYAKIYVGIEVIHQENQGVMMARKKGLLAAKGEYVVFVDADDWIDKDMINYMRKKAQENDADIVFSGLYRENDGLMSIKRDTNIEKKYSRGKKEFFNNFFAREDENNVGVFPSICSKMIRTSVAKKVVEDMNYKMRIYEDMTLITCCSILADNIVILPEVFYHYCMRTESTTHSTNLSFLKDVNYMYNTIRKYSEGQSNEEEIREGLDWFLVDQCIRGLSIYYDLKPSGQFPYYLFPDDVIAPNSRIIVYGAGRVGTSYIRQFMAENKYQIVGWVDKNTEKLPVKGITVSNIDSIEHTEFDYIVVAMKFKGMFDDICETLSDKYKVDKCKIIWKKPQGILDAYFE